MRYGPLLACALWEFSSSHLPKAPSPSSSDEFLVEKVTGSSRYFRFERQPEKTLSVQEKLRVGDVVETRSLATRGSRCPRFAAPWQRSPAIPTFESSKGPIIPDVFNCSPVPFGSVPPSKDKDRGILVETPTVSIESKSSALNIQTTETETVVRVNQGVGRRSQAS